MQETARINGSEIAEQMLDAIARNHPSITKHLTGFVAASDPAGMSFQKAKKRAALRAGVDYRIAAFPESIPHAELAREITAAVVDESCGGIVIQLPLPASLDTPALLNLVPPQKDVDVLSSAAYDAFAYGTGSALPPAARAVEVILGTVGMSLAGKTVAIVGMGKLIGKPVAVYCKSLAENVYELDLGFDENVLGEADLVILGTGAYTLNPGILKAGAGVIDFGYRRTDSGLTGDLDTANQEAIQKLTFYTPTPGGTGPILIAGLIENFARLNA